MTPPPICPCCKREPARRNAAGWLVACESCARKLMGAFA